MRVLLLAAAACAVAAPAFAKPFPIPSETMTVSGRFALPQALAPLAGKVRLGAVKLAPELAQQARQDGAKWEASFREAVDRSLQNHGYRAADGSAAAVTLDVELLPATVEDGKGSTLVATRLKFAATGAHVACFTRQTEGSFRVLDRKRSGGGHRVAAVGAAFALGMMGANLNGSTFLTDQLTMAHEKNLVLNASQKVAPGEGVAPDFGEVRAISYGASAATQLALAEYIRQLGTAEACAVKEMSPS